MRSLSAPTASGGGLAALPVDGHLLADEPRSPLSPLDDFARRASLRRLQALQAATDAAPPPAAAVSTASSAWQESTASATGRIAAGGNRLISAANASPHRGNSSLPAPPAYFVPGRCTPSAGAGGSIGSGGSLETDDDSLEMLRRRQTLLSVSEEISEALKQLAGGGGGGQVGRQQQQQHQQSPRSVVHLAHPPAGSSSSSTSSLTEEDEEETTSDSDSEPRHRSRPVRLRLTLPHSPSTVFARSHTSSPPISTTGRVLSTQSVTPTSSRSLAPPPPAPAASHREDREHDYEAIDAYVSRLDLMAACNLKVPSPPASQTRNNRAAEVRAMMLAPPQSSTWASPATSLRRAQSSAPLALPSLTHNHGGGISPSGSTFVYPLADEPEADFMETTHQLQQQRHSPSMLSTPPAPAPPPPLPRRRFADSPVEHLQADAFGHLPPASGGHHPNCCCHHHTASAPTATTPVRSGGNRFKALLSRLSFCSGRRRRSPAPVLSPSATTPPASPGRGTNISSVAELVHQLTQEAVREDNVSTTFGVTLGPQDAPRRLALCGDYVLRLDTHCMQLLAPHTYHCLLIINYHEILRYGERIGNVLVDVGEINPAATGTFRFRTPRSGALFAALHTLASRDPSMY